MLARLLQTCACEAEREGRDLFIEIADAGVKDIILPDDIREIMNTVLVAEKRAHANVINENQTLYKIKESEYVERICENVGNINLNGNTDVQSQLTGILRGNT